MKRPTLRPYSIPTRLECFADRRKRSAKRSSVAAGRRDLSSSRSRASLDNNRTLRDRSTSRTPRASYAGFFVCLVFVACLAPSLSAQDRDLFDAIATGDASPSTSTPPLCPTRGAYPPGTRSWGSGGQLGSTRPRGAEAISF